MLKFIIKESSDGSDATEKIAKLTLYLICKGGFCYIINKQTNKQ